MIGGATVFVRTIGGGATTCGGGGVFCPAGGGSSGGRRFVLDVEGLHLLGGGLMTLWQGRHQSIAESNVMSATMIIAAVRLELICLRLA
jgi:hypothetical protein